MAVEIVLQDQCKAHSRSGARCKRRPIPGGTVCIMHGGASPQAQQAAAQRLLEAKIRGQLVQRGWEPVSDPIAAILDTAGEVLAFRDLCRERLADCVQWEHRGEAGEQTSAAVQIYERALDRSVQALSKIVSLGIQAQAAKSATISAQRNLDSLRLLVADAREHPDTPADELILQLIGG